MGVAGAAGPRIEETAVFVDVGEYQRGVIVECVVDAVAVMGVDVDVGDSAQSVVARKPASSNQSRSNAGAAAPADERAVSRTTAPAEESETVQEQSYLAWAFEAEISKS